MNKCQNSECINLTVNPRFCSKSCAAKTTNKESPKRKLTRLCTKCNSVIRNSKSTLCEDHFQKHKVRFRQDLTIGEYRNKLSVKGKHPSWFNSHARHFARSWLKHLRELPCAKCGYELHVELAHVKSVSSYPDETKLAEVNKEENVIQLCPNCHWEFDNLPREGLFTDLLKSLNKLE